MRVMLTLEASDMPRGCTQTLVLFVIRTYERPWRSKPSAALASSILIVVAFGAILPATPLAAVLGFTPMPASYFAFVAIATIAYLAVVEIAKRALVRRGTLARPLPVLVASRPSVSSDRHPSFQADPPIPPRHGRPRFYTSGDDPRGR
jgi:hypothetical protein